MSRLQADDYSMGVLARGFLGGLAMERDTVLRVKVAVYSVFLTCGVFVGLVVGAMYLDGSQETVRVKIESKAGKPKIVAAAVELPKFERGALTEYFTADRMEGALGGKLVFVRPTRYELWPGTKWMKTMMSADVAEVGSKDGKPDFGTMKWSGDFRYRSYDKNAMLGLAPAVEGRRAETPPLKQPMEK